VEAAWVGVTRDVSGHRTGNPGAEAPGDVPTDSDHPVGDEQAAERTIPRLDLGDVPWQMTKDTKIQIDLDEATIDGVDARADAIGDSREDMIVRLVKIGLAAVPGDNTARKEVSAPTTD
jgi:hypothetical protein